jgi:hypothetical protein
MYLIDSDVFIDEKNCHYGFDIVPAFWAWIQQQHVAGRVFTVQRVVDEVVAGADELADWMKTQPASFRLAPSTTDQPALENVSRWAGAAGYRPSAVATFLGAGDYFLVAQALSRGFTVITQETSEPTVSKKRIKIPTACQALGVTCMNPFAMLRTESARFVL